MYTLIVPKLYDFFVTQRFWNAGFCEYGEACHQRHTPRPVMEEARAER